MPSKPFRSEILTKNHDLAQFSSGNEHLDRYLKQFARQDMERGVATAFVLVDNTDERVAGFYSLSTLSIQLLELPADIRKKLPKYPDVPAVLLGRLARDLRYRGRGCGELLLLDALRRAFGVTSDVAAFAVVVDAKDDAVEFYGRYGFQPFADEPRRMFLPMKKIKDLMRPEV